MEIHFLVKKDYNIAPGNRIDELRRDLKIKSKSR